MAIILNNIEKYPYINGKKVSKAYVGNTLIYDKNYYWLVKDGQIVNNIKLTHWLVDGTSSNSISTKYEADYNFFQGYNITKGNAKSVKTIAQYDDYVRIVLESSTTKSYCGTNILKFNSSKNFNILGINMDGNCTVSSTMSGTQNRNEAAWFILHSLYYTGMGSTTSKSANYTYSFNNTYVPNSQSNGFFYSFTYSHTLHNSSCKATINIYNLRLLLDRDIS